MNTRKSFIRDGLGLAAIVAAQTSPAVIVRSMVAARIGIAAAKRGGGWINPYVTDGLVAMWDGEWNAGGGVHDSTITDWFDLSGNNHAFHAPSPVWRENHAEYIEDANSLFRATASEAAWARTLFEAGTYTLEFVANASSGKSDCSFFTLGLDGSGIYTQGSVLNAANNGYTFRSGASTRYGVIAYGVGATDARYMAASVSGQTASFYANGTVQTATNVPLPSIGNNGLAFGFRCDLYNLANRLSWIAGINLYRLAIYSRSLAADEIAANCAVDKERFGLT